MTLAELKEIVRRANVVTFAVGMHQASNDAILRETLRGVNDHIKKELAGVQGRVDQLQAECVENRKIRVATRNTAADLKKAIAKIAALEEAMRTENPHAV